MVGAISAASRVQNGSAEQRWFAMNSGAIPPDAGVNSAEVEQGFRRGFVGDKSVDDPAAERRVDRKDLAGPLRHTDHQTFRRHRPRSAGQPVVGATFDESSRGIEGPSGDFTYGANAPHFGEFVGGNKTVHRNVTA